jgi:hypothetical protein
LGTDRAGDIHCQRPLHGDAQRHPGAERGAGARAAQHLADASLAEPDPIADFLLRQAELLAGWVDRRTECRREREGFARSHQGGRRSTSPWLRLVRCRAVHRPDHRKQRFAATYLAAVDNGAPNRPLGG